LIDSSEVGVFERLSQGQDGVLRVVPFEVGPLREDQDGTTRRSDATNDAGNDHIEAEEFQVIADGWQAADGTGAVEALTEGTARSTSQVPGSFSPDGTRLVLREITPKTGYDISLLTLETPRRTTPLVQTAFTEYNPEISPDGRWLTYESNESGQFEVYVRPFPDVAAGRWQVSTGGGRQPLWARSGRELFYGSLASPGRIMAVQIPPGPTFSAGNPQMIVDGPYAGAPGGIPVPLSGRTYDVSADGQRFLMIKQSVSTNTAAPAQIVVVQHWLEDLKRLVPTN